MTNSIKSFLSLACIITYCVVSLFMPGPLNASDAMRFELVMNDEAVLDHKTGLIWERTPTSNGMTWQAAVNYAGEKIVGGTDGWRLPKLEELASLIDLNYSKPTLPEGHPFINIKSSYYWTAWSFENEEGSKACAVYLKEGGWFCNDRSENHNVWCVRGEID